MVAVLGGGEGCVEVLGFGCWWWVLLKEEVVVLGVVVGGGW